MAKAIKSKNINFGYSCNNNCIHCMIPYEAREERKDRSTQEIKELIKQAKEEGAEQIIFIGGEVTIRDDFFELLKFARDLNMNLHLETNARTCSSESFAKRILDIMPDLSVAMSFHHPDSDVHDRITRVEGSWKQSVQGIKNLKKYGLEHLTAIPVISKLNYESLPELAKFLQEKDVDEVDFTLMWLRGKAKKYLDKLLVSIQEIQPHLFEALEVEGIQTRTYGFPYCTLGEYKDHAYETNFIQTFLENKTYVWHGIGETIDWQDERIARKRKAEKCKECKFFNVCEGLWKEYLEVFGSEVLRPVEGKKIKNLEEFD